MAKNQACPTMERLCKILEIISANNTSFLLLMTRSAVFCIISNPLLNLILSILHSSYHKNEACRYSTPHKRTHTFTISKSSYINNVSLFLLHDDGMSSIPRFDMPIRLVQIPMQQQSSMPMYIQKKMHL